MSIIGSLPFTLTNGTTADATQVMSDFNTIVSNVNSSAAASGANADITSLTALTTPLSPASGGSQMFVATGASTGSPNQQVVTTLVPGNFTLTAGFRVSFIAGFTNNGPVMLNVNSTGLTVVKFRTSGVGGGLLNLIGGEFVVNEVATVEYDGTLYQLLDPIPQELTWTPFFGGSISNGVVTYTNQTGRYSRSGNLVNIWGRVTISAVTNSPTGDLQIQGLPFPAAAVGGVFGLSVIWGGLVLTAGYTQVGASVLSGASNATLYQSGSGVPIITFSSGLSATGDVEIFGSYRLN